jgi:hypothetical protein
MTTKDTASKAKHPCACKLIAKNACGADTWATFAPGHDARMKGLLQKAHRAGVKVLMADKRRLTAMEVAAEIAPKLVTFLDPPVVPAKPTEAEVPA